MIRINRTTLAVVGLALVTIGLSVFAVGTPIADATTEPPAPTADAVGVQPQVSDNLSLTAYNDGTYSVKQGDRCIPITPLGDGYQTAEEYYDYRHPETNPSSYMYSSHGTTHLQEGDTSRLFLHDGGDGLNLGIVHGELEGSGDGGGATFVFSGLPDGEWAVTDDQYDIDTENGSATNDDVWDSRADASRVSWTWADGRTDGGMYTGLGDDFSITISPAFNDAADLQLNDGEITDWQVVSGDDRDPQTTSLDMTEPIELRSGGCTAVTALDVEGSSGDSVSVNATVTNQGDAEETVTVPIALDGEVVDEHELTVAPNGAVTFNASVSIDGAETVSVGGASASIEPDDGGFASRLPGFGVPVALAALVFVLALGARQRR
ncbi:hypothetical protein C479_06387 [Halovivax asiaticus JCM 14624]|uniref:CARDB domain-containing protein n=1 Tax=Halovivax asiaticus JCM 14624 TaxID=1227490 RepID=M0BL99_9EURY|nr:hypothetical protein [Halovivax asiaticus]ELZ11661.1 hypothetical protein C479_06387 [Halovivax asiaticus JCM 14624]